MESIIEQNTMKACQQTKAFANQNMKVYLDFAVKTLGDAEFVKSAMALLPFDNFADARLRFMDASSQVKSMGFSVMRMELIPATYSLGISIEISEGEYNTSASPTIFLTAFQPLEQLREYVKGQKFSLQVTEFFDSQIDNSFYPSNN